MSAFNFVINQWARVQYADRFWARCLAWFGIQESVEDYVAVADRSPSVIASLGGEDVGLLTLIHHSPFASEVYVMGVPPDHHRRGIAEARRRRHLARAGARVSSGKDSERQASRTKGTNGRERSTLPTTFGRSKSS